MVHPLNSDTFISLGFVMIPFFPSDWDWLEGFKLRIKNVRFAGATFFPNH